MQPSKKTVFVTGAAGFIGCNLVHNLLASDAYRVIGIDKLNYAGNLNSLAEVMENPNFSFEQTDICDAKAITD
ncbi:MAG: NAD-dependent epimerase/dehydratase family protein, partial [Mariniblastus sp.]|nr:NAD-dependent epimerase/dehydratase family protein [Mariniblastus sp.]